MNKKWLSTVWCALLLVGGKLWASEEKPSKNVLAESFAEIAQDAKAAQEGYATWILSGGKAWVSAAAGLIGGAVATGAGTAVNGAYQAATLAMQPVAAVGDWTLKKTIETLADKFAAVGAGDLAKDLLDGKSSTDVLAGIGIGAAMYFTLMKAYGAVAKDMGTDLSALMKAIEKLKVAQGFEERAPHTKVVVTHLWVVMDDILNMLAVLEKPLAQASKLTLQGTKNALVPSTYVDALRSVTITYAAYLHAILEMVGNVVPDMFEYVGDLEQLADILTPKNKK